MTYPKPYHIEPTPAAQSAASDFVLDSYIMHIRTARCTRCGGESKWSETNEVLVHRTRVGLSGLRRLLPARQINPGYRIAVSTLPPTHTPTCWMCVESLSHSGSGFAAERISSESEWAATLKRKYAAPTPAPRSEGVQAPPKSPKHIPSASDL